MKGAGNHRKEVIKCQAWITEGETLHSLTPDNWICFKKTIMGKSHPETRLRGGLWHPPLYPLIPFSSWINERKTQGGYLSLVCFFHESKSRPTEDCSRNLERTLVRFAQSANYWWAPTMCRHSSRQQDVTRNQRKGQVTWSFYSHHGTHVEAFLLACNSSQTTLPPEICKSLLFSNLLQTFTPLTPLLQGPLLTTLWKLVSPSRTILPSYFPSLTLTTI